MKKFLLFLLLVPLVLAQTAQELEFANNQATLQGDAKLDGIPVSSPGATISKTGFTYRVDGPVIIGTIPVTNVEEFHIEGDLYQGVAQADGFIANTYLGAGSVFVYNAKTGELKVQKDSTLERWGPQGLSSLALRDGSATVFPNGAIVFDPESSVDIEVAGQRIQFVRIVGNTVIRSDDKSITVKGIATALISPLTKAESASINEFIGQPDDKLPKAHSPLDYATLDGVNTFHYSLQGLQRIESLEGRVAYISQPTFPTLENPNHQGFVSVASRGEPTAIHFNKQSYEASLLPSNSLVEIFDNGDFFITSSGTQKVVVSGLAGSEAPFQTTLDPNGRLLLKKIDGELTYEIDGEGRDRLSSVNNGGQYFEYYGGTEITQITRTEPLFEGAPGGEVAGTFVKATATTQHNPLGTLVVDTVSGGSVILPAAVVAGQVSNPRLAQLYTERTKARLELLDLQNKWKGARLINAMVSYWVFGQTNEDHLNDLIEFKEQEIKRLQTN